MGRVEVRMHAFLNAELDIVVSGKLHVPATLPLGKEPLISAEQQARWASDQVLALGRRNYHLFLQEIQP